MIAWLRAHRADLLRVAGVGAGLAIVAFLTAPPARPELATASVTDVRGGGYAAWEALLQAEGVAVERFAQRPIELDGTIDTLIDAYGTEPIEATSRGRADTQALADWVRAGGRLILIGRIDALAAREARALARPQQRAAAQTGPPLDAARFGGVVTQLATASAQRFIVPAPKVGASVLLADRGGPIALRVPLGHGAIVYVSDAAIFSNANLNRADNARFAYLLARPRGAGRIVAFDEALHAPPLERGWIGTLGIPERVAIFGIIAVVLVALAGGALRLGPPVRLRVQREPPSDEFIAALASLYRTAKARHAALALLATHAGGHGETAMQLRLLRERPTPTDRDVITGAALARTLRRETR
jgi:hypothetical protein